MSTDTQSLARKTCVSVRLIGALSLGLTAFKGDHEAADLESADGSAGGIGHLPAGYYAGVIAALVAAGSLSLFPLWLAMWRLWATDPLRSIGATFPLVSSMGVLAAWRRLGWSTNGTFWALPVVALALLLARAVTVTSFIVGYDGLHLGLLNLGGVLFLYGVGAVLLFGGTRLLRASIAPLCLLLFINPVPGLFNSLVDLPLQHLSAFTARSFAHLIGLHPTGGQLRLMFAPDFGMFIAPGCNGVRGSITMGFLVLVFGYVLRLRPRTLAFAALAAFLLGYALNLLRLCVLVVYYRAGLSIPSIQEYGVGVDYVIGGTLFLLATLGVGLLMRSLKPSPATGVGKAQLEPASESSRHPLAKRPLGYATVVRALCFLALTLVCAVTEFRSTPSTLALRPTGPSVLNSFPASVGTYKLQRTWAEHNGSGRVVLALAEYSASPGAGNSASRLTFGLWLGPGSHLVAYSKFAQGISAQSTGSFSAATRQALPVHFVTSFYDDGIVSQYDAESVCADAGCSALPLISNHEGLFFQAPSFSDFTPVPRGQRLPILLRREWHDSEPNASPSDLRLQFETDARLFMAQIDLGQLLRQIGYSL